MVARSQAFTYDNLNRILTAKESTAWGVSFTTSTGSPGIDAWGNVFQTSSISGTSINPMSMTQVIGDNNRFTVNGYGYDAAGNVLNDGITTGCGTYGYTWNAEEQMTCAAGSTYTYDGDGIRVEKTGGNATPTMYWGAGNLAESNTSGTLTSEYIFAGGKRIARRDIATGSVYYYFTDMLGSSSVLATSSGGVENESDYEPYGGEANVTQSLTNQHYKFEGKERDPETGLDNFGARFSNSNMGRFMSPDWANKPEPVPYSKLSSPQSLNLYAFAGNNPESAPDLDGHEADDTLDGFNNKFDAAMGSACAGGISAACGGSGSDESGGRHGPGGSEGTPEVKNGSPAQQQSSPRVVDIVNSALKQPGLGACLNTWIGSGLVLTNANLPFMNATKSSDQLAAMIGYSGGGDVDGTTGAQVAPTGRSTVYVASGVLGDKDRAMRTYIHETGNALAMQRFAGGDAAGAYVGPRGGPQSAAQRSDPIDHDIGNQIERCVFGPPPIYVAPQSITVTAQ